METIELQHKNKALQEMPGDKTEAIEEVTNVLPQPGQFVLSDPQLTKALDEAEFDSIRVLEGIPYKTIARQKYH